jgi:hypothetical protein
VLGGLAGAWLIARIAAWKPAAAPVAAAVIAMGCIQPVIEMTKLHPYEYTYFNMIEGGVQAADPRYMLDYWGLSFKQAGEALHAKLWASRETPVGHPQWKVAACGPHPAARIALGPGYEVDWNPQGADFALMLAEYYCRELDAPVFVEIKRDGVVYARVYDIRGRSIDTLLTIPPP